MKVFQGISGRFVVLTTVLVALLLVALPGVASAAPPLATTKAATEVGTESATMNGLVNPLGLPTTYWFEYGTSEEYGSKTTETNAGFGFSSVEVSAMLEGLSAGITYHFRVVAKNVSGTTKGVDEVFALQSSANTEAATGVFAKKATLHGSINPGGLATTFWFEYGTTEEYSSKTEEESAGASNELVKESAVIEGLSPGTTYHFAFVASNGKGTVKGGDMTFTTPEHSWQLQETPDPKPSGSVLESVACLSGSECIAVGESSGALSESWNGTEWSLISMPNPKASNVEIDSVSCTSFTACTAVGHSTVSTTDSTLVERWNGTEWKIQESPNKGGAQGSVLHGVSCATSTSCIAVGNYLDNEGKWFALAESWNGTEWKLQEMPSPSGKSINYVYDISCTSSSACTAVGYSSGTTLVERWNGTEWKVQTTPKGGSTLESVSCTSSTSCMAVGNIISAEGTYAEAWNGTEWKTVVTPTPPEAVRAVLTGVSCELASACSAVGWYETEPGSGTAYSLAEIWNGSKWEIQTTPDPVGSGVLEDVSCVSSVLCEAVGHYNGGPIFGYAERYE